MTSQSWYIVQQSTGHCEIVSEIVAESDLPADPTEKESPETANQLKRWGPFSSRNEAIAKRVGLIRAGQCQPI
ncbi:MAG: hypothetical protein B0A82_09385 [Alkalinema sp. CACIAM 70d]|nr:MAG: hypothetical protein B0A82_09385 [Alkalinema sp. CACIAM 70d]